MSVEKRNFIGCVKDTGEGYLTTLAHDIYEDLMAEEEIRIAVKQMKESNYMDSDGLKYLVETAMLRGFSNKEIEEDVWGVVEEKGNKAVATFIRFWFWIYENPLNEKTIKSCNGNLLRARLALEGIEKNEQN